MGPQFMGPQGPRPGMVMGGPGPPNAMAGPKPDRFEGRSQGSGSAQHHPRDGGPRMGRQAAGNSEHVHAPGGWWCGLRTRAAWLSVAPRQHSLWWVCMVAQ